MRSILTKVSVWSVEWSILIGMAFILSQTLLVLV